MTEKFWGSDQKLGLYILLAIFLKSHHCCLFLPCLPGTGRRERRALLTSSGSNPPATESENVQHCKHELVTLIFYPKCFLLVSITMEEVSSADKCLFLEARKREISISI